jgi:hypothetical protein
MAIHEFINPIPVIVEENKEGIAIYVRDNGTFDNDCWCVVLKEGGTVRHYLSNQIKVHHNATYNIKK